MADPLRAWKKYLVILTDIELKKIITIIIITILQPEIVSVKKNLSNSGMAKFQIPDM